MGFVPAPNCAKVEMIFSSDSGQMENVYHIEGDAPFDITSLALVAVEFRDWYANEFQDDLPNTISLVKIIVSALDTDHAPGIEFSTGLPMVGTNTAAALPSNVTAAVKWTTGLRGRSYRGRTYHIGLSEAMVTGDTISSGVVSSLQTGYQNLIDELDTTPWHLVVVSRVSDGVERTTAVVTEIAAVNVDNTVDSQRRRLKGRGR